MRYVANLKVLAVKSLKRNIDMTTEAGTAETVREILSRVSSEGDQGLIVLTEKLDGIRYQSPEEMRVPVAQLTEALRSLDEGVRLALEQAAANIRTFHSLQVPHPMVWEQPGKRVALRLDPLARVALYVPGGMAAYPSSVLMNAIPAQVAGVPQIAVFTPPTRDRRQLEAVYATCALLGLTEVYALGGAQAVAAAAFGTQSIPPCDLITGPGNQYVTEAKRQVMDRVKIDMLAGPSELLIVADATANATFVAADLLAQAEHDPQAGLYLVLIGSETEVQGLSRRITGAIKDLLTIQPSQNAAISIENLQIYGCPDVTISAAIANQIAPEHLSLQFADASDWSGAYTAAGSIFVGSYTPEAVADYAAGANHVLPTAGTSRYASALGVATFLRATQVVEYSAQGLESDGLASMVLAQRERLPYHAKSLALRLGRSLKLNANENPSAYWLDNSAITTLSEVLPELTRSYPADGYPDLKPLLAKTLSSLFPDKLQPSSSLQSTLANALVLGNGSDELLDVLLRALVPAKSRVAVLDPSFSEYARFLTINHLGAVPIASNPSTGLYEPEALLQQLIEAASSCRALLLCNPNNPTGQRFSQAWLERLLGQVPSNCLVILDEAYMDFCPEQDTEPWYALRYPNVIQVRTLSKAYGAAGLRFGYALLAPPLDQSLAPYLAPYRLSSPTTALATLALQRLATPEGKAAFLDNRAAMLNEKAKLLTLFSSIPASISAFNSASNPASSPNQRLTSPAPFNAPMPDAPSLAGNFLWLPLSPQQRQAIDQLNLKVRSFQEPWSDYVRITLGTPLQTSLLLSALEEGATAHARFSSSLA